MRLVVNSPPPGVTDSGGMKIADMGSKYSVKYMKYTQSKYEVKVKGDFYGIRVVGTG